MIELLSYRIELGPDGKFLISNDIKLNWDEFVQDKFELKRFSNFACCMYKCVFAEKIIPTIFV